GREIRLVEKPAAEATSDSVVFGVDGGQSHQGGGAGDEALVVPASDADDRLPQSAGTEDLEGRATVPGAATNTGTTPPQEVIGKRDIADGSDSISRGELIDTSGTFRYECLGEGAAEKVRSVADRIRQKIKRTIQDIIEIGYDLLEVKGAL